MFAVRGRIGGNPVLAYATDPLKMGGAMGTAGCLHIVAAIDAALDEGVPVLGLWHSGGARLAEGVEALHAVGLVFEAMIRASGKIPQLSVVLGPAAGGAAYGPALTDVVIMSSGGRVFVTGPEVVRSVTGENVDMESLGGTDTHGRRSGVVHVTTDTEAEAFTAAREITMLMADQGSFDPARHRSRQQSRRVAAREPQARLRRAPDRGRPRRRRAIQRTARAVGAEHRHRRSPG